MAFRSDRPRKPPAKWPGSGTGSTAWHRYAPMTASIHLPHSLRSSPIGTAEPSAMEMDAARSAQRARAPKITREKYAPDHPCRPCARRRLANDVRPAGPESDQAQQRARIRPSARRILPLVGEAAALASSGARHGRWGSRGAGRLPIIPYGHGRLSPSRGSIEHVGDVGGEQVEQVSQGRYVDDQRHALDDGRQSRLKTHVDGQSAEAPDRHLRRTTPRTTRPANSSAAQRDHRRKRRCAWRCRPRWRRQDPWRGGSADSLAAHRLQHGAAGAAHEHGGKEMT